MRPPSRAQARPISIRRIAPCGMDCALCIGHLRARNPCPGCNDPRAALKPPHCVRCAIKTCAVPRRPPRFCFECRGFPCARLRRLDLRYRTKYGMSMVENLEFIRSFGIRKFVAREKIRWACPACGRRLCVHRRACLHCGHPRPSLPTPKE